MQAFLVLTQDLLQDTVKVQVRRTDKILTRQTRGKGRDLSQRGRVNLHTDEFANKEKWREEREARRPGSLKEIWEWGWRWHERDSGAGAESERTGLQGKRFVKS